MSPTITTESRVVAIEALPLLSPDARRILYQLAEEVSHFERRISTVPTNIRVCAQEDFQLALQMFELAVKAAGGEYRET
jgi:hypothetical protein